MKVFKFGGASVKNAEGVKNLTSIITNYKNEKIAIVISAMGKTTNAFENILNEKFKNNKNYLNSIFLLKQFHHNIINELFETELKEKIFQQISSVFDLIINELDSSTFSNNYDFEYDKLISWGEIISTKIVYCYFQEKKLSCLFADAREFIITDNNYRNASVNWDLTNEKCNLFFNNNFKNVDYIITQGFIGSSIDNATTTLGREGSDFTAGIIAYSLNAESVTIWKDVPGLLNADPKWFENTVQLENISYHEAIELAYYGATIIHPKTIQPIKKKNIPLFVKSFQEPDKPGSLINSNNKFDSKTPSFIFKVNQILISISTKDFTFIVEENLSHIFSLFAKHKVSINLMENSSISFSVVANFDERKISPLIEELNIMYNVLYNLNVELATIRHYDDKTIQRVTNNKKIFISQQSRKTIRFVMIDKNK